MRRFEDIHYLRWARAMAAPPHPEIGLVLSGMTPPAHDWIGPLEPGEVLDFPVSDHPPLAHEMAAAWGVAPERVTLASGSHTMLFLLIAARLGERPGPVVVEEPTYEPLLRIPEALGATVLRWPRRRALDLALDPETLPGLAAANPSLVVLTHPHNPSGRLLGASDRERLAQLRESTGCAVLSDEVYLEFADEPAALTMLREPGVAIVRSFTKVFGLGTLRVSAAAGPSGWIARAAALGDYFGVAPAGPSQSLARRAWARREEYWRRARAAMAAGRAELLTWADRNRDFFELPVPEAGIIAFPRPRAPVGAALVAAARRAGVEGPFGFGLDPSAPGSQGWIEHLRRERGVQLTPGAFFGEPEAFRVGFGVSAEVVREGLRRLEAHVRTAMEAA